MKFIKDYVEPALIVLLLGYGGYDVFSDRNAVAQVDAVFKSITAKQIRQCVTNSTSHELGVSQERCRELVDQWQRGEPLSSDYDPLFSGWVFGGLED